MPRKKFWKGWSEEQITYMKWLVSGDPKENKETIAKKIGVKVETLDRWTHKPGFWDMINTLTDQSLHQSRPQIYKRLIKAATKTEPDIAAAKLLLEILGDYRDPRRQSKLEQNTQTIYKWEGEDDLTEPFGEASEEDREDNNTQDSPETDNPV